MKPKGVFWQKVRYTRPHWNCGKNGGSVLEAVTHVAIFKQGPDAPPVEASTFEPGFEYTRALHPNHSEQQWCEGLARFLERRIRRFPKDLTAHVQRVNALVAARADGDQLYAAALGLNAVLAGKGAALQQRILDQISFTLDAQQRADLVAMLAGPPPAASPAELLGSLPHSNAKRLRIVSEIKHEPKIVSEPQPALNVA